MGMFFLLYLNKMVSSRSIPINFHFLVSSIDCFKCVSVGGDNPVCEDKFHNNHTELLEVMCNMLLMMIMIMMTMMMKIRMMMMIKTIMIICIPL